MPFVTFSERYGQNTLKTTCNLEQFVGTTAKYEFSVKKTCIFS